MGTIAQIKGSMAESRPGDTRLRGAFALTERAVQIGYWRYDLVQRTHFWSPERMDLGESMDDCLRILKDQALNGRVALSSELKGPVMLQADRRAVKQVLLNLLSNAVKFTPPEGKVVISAWKERGRALVAVRDTGIGVSPADLARLGNPFEQAKTDAMLAKGGTGLGLALVKALVEKHGGTLVMKSTLGKGTTVTVDFPLPQRARARG